MLRRDLTSYTVTSCELTPSVPAMLLAIVDLTSLEKFGVSVAESSAGKLSVSATIADEGADVGVNETVAMRVQTSDAPDRKFEKAVEAHAHTAFEEPDAAIFA